MRIRPLPRLSLFALPLAVVLAAAPGAALAAELLEDAVRLKPTITVEGGVVTLGDVFEGELAHADAIVTQAPKPGNRMLLSAEWLAATARNYGIDWQPRSGLDRAVVFQPGQTVGSRDILDAVKDSLVASGLPDNYGLTPSAPIASVTIALSAAKSVEVREATYDAATRQFSASVHIPANDPQATVVSVRGAAFATISVPVPKQPIGKQATISADMIEFIDLPEDEVRPLMITDADQLIGKTPKLFLKAGRPVRDSDLIHVTYVQIPVLIADMDRDGRIGEEHIKMIEINANAVPTDGVTAPESLIGKSARRPLVAGTPLRRFDLTTIREIEVPVATRDLPRGTLVTEADVDWVMMKESEAGDDLVADVAEIIGQVTRLTVRSGRPLRNHALGKAVAVNRGQPVTVTWSVQSINLTAQGQAMEKGGIGDLIRVQNTKSNQTVVAQIIDSRTVRVAAPDQAPAR